MLRSLSFLGVILLTFAAVAAAQERELGLKFGASIATLDPGGRPSALPYDPRVGLTWGAFGVLPLKGRLSTQIELLFTEKGGQQDLNDPSIVSGSLDDRLQFHYLDLPILLRVRGPAAGSARLHVFAGPTLSLRLSAKRQASVSGIGSFGFETDIDDDVDRFDTGLTFGGGADIGQYVLVDARYTWGFGDVLEREPGTFVSNRGLLLTAGIRILKR